MFLSVNLCSERGCVAGGHGAARGHDIVRPKKKTQQHSNGGTLLRGKCAFKITSLPTKHVGCIRIRRMDAHFPNPPTPQNQPNTEHTCSTKETGLTVVLPFPFRCRPLSKSGEDTRLWSEDGPGEPEAEETRTAQSKNRRETLINISSSVESPCPSVFCLLHLRCR